ncbi:hypothetical protein [Sporolactobacillus pectinivorans]|uniref:hypothetical protein n=1 Tax=Sporolactobacillus pectinivorans TaxID=1591408 RepID=UPI000C25E393|nr:hypothetical protein [Sporolactobacillus pectinivorans]
MEKYSLEKHRKLIESIRFFAMFALGFLTNSHLLLALILALVLGATDQIFIRPKLRPRDKRNDL